MLRHVSKAMPLRRVTGVMQVLSTTWHQGSSPGVVRTQLPLVTAVVCPLAPVTL